MILPCRSQRRNDRNTSVSNVSSFVFELATMAFSSHRQARLETKASPIAYNQQQVVEASAVIAVFGDVKSYEKAEKIYGRAVDAGFMQEDIAKSFLERSVETYSNLPPEVARQIVCTDGGLISMQIMLIARSRVTTPFQWAGTIKRSSLKLLEFLNNMYQLCLLQSEKQQTWTSNFTYANGDVISFNEMP